MSNDNEKNEEFEKFKASNQEILRNLTAREAKVLRARFGIDLENSANLEDIGKQFEVTRERIRQIEAKALKMLRKRKDDDDDNDPVPA